MEIKFRDKKILLERGDLYVVPRGTDHKPYAKGECKIMLIEPKGVINTGSLVNNFTKQKEEWVQLTSRLNPIARNFNFENILNLFNKRLKLTFNLMIENLISEGLKNF